MATYVHIIGAGGAARAAAVGAWKSGRGDIEFSNRTAEKAREIAVWFGLPEDYGTGLDGLEPGESSDDTQRYSKIFINASSMGMTGYPPVPIDLGAHPADTVVFEMVYDPVETELLKSARALGLRTFDGLQMLVAQAAHAFELFFGAPAPREHDSELRELLTR
jgi:shikimate dehydrogenase